MFKDIHTHTHTAIVGLDIPIFGKLYDLYKLSTQYLTSFPKAKRYTLGQKIDQTIIDIIELVIMAGYLPREQKLPSLQKVSIKLDLLKIFLRLSIDTKCIDNNKYQQILLQTLEIGRMLGGWIKTVK
ncbi:MAG: S23 ribosomal protein [Microgenomates group bacterium Gr01-1014_7]|nr:MAG: S23 ribosomal protein [Microgenomates group bacterium Gr01-1014_7]